MPPRVAYWTSAFDADMEAIASEVALLRRQFPGSIAWGLSTRHWGSLSWRRGYSLHPRLHLVFRLATRLFEPAFDVNHVFGSAGDWFYLQGQKCRPTVLTVAAHAPPVDAAMLRRVEQFVVEHPGGITDLVKNGVDRDRVRLILPPVDLGRFHPAPRPAHPFTVLFASSPDKASWLDARGVPQILEAAERRPAMRFRLLWRPWGDAGPRVAAWIKERGLTNVQLETGKWSDMGAQYRAAHACIAPFTDASRAKPAPNSVIESLACGRPVVVTPTVGLADLIQEHNAGLVCAPDGEQLAIQLDQIQADWDSYSCRARELAERKFGMGRFVRSYRQLYEEMMCV